MICFRPSVDETIIGSVKNCTNEGIQISLNFFDDIFIPAAKLKHPSKLYDLLFIYFLLLVILSSKIGFGNMKATVRLLSCELKRMTPLGLVFYSLFYKPLDFALIKKYGKIQIPLTKTNPVNRMRLSVASLLMSSW